MYLETWQKKKKIAIKEIEKSILLVFPICSFICGSLPMSQNFPLPLLPHLVLACFYSVNSLLSGWLGMMMTRVHSVTQTATLDSQLKTWPQSKNGMRIVEMEEDKPPKG